MLMKEVYINIEHEIFRGNVLDIGFKNQGIVYSLLNKYGSDFDIEYLEEGNSKEYIEEEQYDNCILFFALKKVMGNRNKKALIKDIYKYLKPDGVLHIWDIDKAFGKGYVGNIRLSLPGEKIKEFRIIDMNLFKDNSKESIMNLLDEYFDVQECKCSEGIYLIRCRKKGRNDDESNIDSG